MESISGNYYMKSSPQNIIWYWNSGESKKRYIETKYKIVIIIGEEIKKVETHKPKLSKKKWQQSRSIPDRKYFNKTVTELKKL